jgi:hypothetical protein
MVENILLGIKIQLNQNLKIDWEKLVEIPHARRFTASDIQRLEKLYDCPSGAKTVTWNITVQDHVEKKRGKHIVRNACSTKKRGRNAGKRRQSR